MPDDPLPCSPVALPGNPVALPLAWQPFTLRGVAAFSITGVSRLLLVELFMALLAAAVVCWFLATSWFPVVREGIRQLPATGAIEDGEMKWAGPPYQLLSERRPFLALLVDLENQ